MTPPQLSDSDGQPFNQVPPAARAGHLPPVVNLINATGGFFHPSYEDWRKAILEHLHGEAA